jgi:hypothetical protein
MIAKVIMPHIFFTSSHTRLVMPGKIRASINFHEMFLWWVAGT